MNGAHAINSGIASREHWRVLSRQGGNYPCSEDKGTQGLTVRNAWHARAVACHSQPASLIQIREASLAMLQAELAVQQTAIHNRAVSKEIIRTMVVDATFAARSYEDDMPMKGYLTMERSSWLCKLKKRTTVTMPTGRKGKAAAVGRRACFILL